MKRILIASTILAPLAAGCTNGVTTVSNDAAQIATGLNADIATVSKETLPAMCAIGVTLDGVFKISAYASDAAKAADEAKAIAALDAICASPPSDTATVIADVIKAVAAIKSASAPAGST